MEDSEVQFNFINRSREDYVEDRNNSQARQGGENECIQLNEQTGNEDYYGHRDQERVRSAARPPVLPRHEPPYRNNLSIRPEIFNGTDDWSTYITHFEICAELGQWNPREKTLALLASLRGDAQKFAMTMRRVDRETYQTVKSELESRFGKTRQQQMWISRFESRLRDTCEDYAILGDDLRYLVQRAYPNMQHEAQEMIALNQFYKSVPNEIKYKCLAERCQTIQETILVIEIYVSVFHPSVQQSQYVRMTSQQHENDQNSENSTIRRLEEKIQHLKMS